MLLRIRKNPKSGDPVRREQDRKESILWLQEPEKYHDQNDKTDKEKSGKQGIFRHPCESSHQSAEEKTFCLQEDAESTRSHKKGKRTGDQGKI